MNEKFRAQDVTMLLIDHQVGTMGWVKSLPFEEMKLNAMLMAKTASVLKIPTVLTSSMEDRAQGPLLPELQEILPAEFAARIQRKGVIDAMEDENFANAVMATRRRKFIVAGVTNDVCTVHPTLTLLRLGYDVQVVADAGGSPSKLADDMALLRMYKAGATLTGAMQALTELVGTWASPEGIELARETAKLRELRR
ncbi:isochorismatase family protein [Achromobacter xylosoxidans]|uniref:isochorismatase family protein n=1 Tax=Achromobacter TaxID=222 RepID=UPI0008A3A9E2|nr:MULTISPECIES: isochorismatase family protein [Achromobacter]MCH4579990.1 isochorismatase family protein [Achromobacter xylosoxidans]OFU72930.1 isochorismatase [Achromobacter xylosoxidans]PWY42813.1 isochorismatase [Achromobacter sp. RW408]